MNKENFELLLTDLYTHYNKAKLKDIQMLVAKYSGRENDAVKSVFIMYNSKYNPDKEKYNLEFGTDNHVQFLINSYSEGKRVFSQEVLNEKIKEKEELKNKLKQKEENEKKKKIQEIGGELKEEIQEAVNSKVEEYFNTKKGEVDKMLTNLFDKRSSEIEKFFEDKKKEIKKNVDAVPEIVNKILSNEDFAIKKKEPKEEDIVEVKLTFLNFGEKDLVLPSESIMKNMGIGERMIVRDSIGKVCGIAIKDIAYDGVSFEEDKYVKDISIEKL